MVQINIAEGHYQRQGYQDSKDTWIQWKKKKKYLHPPNSPRKLRNVILLIFPACLKMLPLVAAPSQFAASQAYPANTLAFIGILLIVA